MVELSQGGLLPMLLPWLVILDQFDIDIDILLNELKALRFSGSCKVMGLCQKFGNLKFGRPMKMSSKETANRVDNSPSTN